MSFVWETVGDVAMRLEIKDTDVVIIPEQHLYHKSIITVPEMVQDNQNIINEILDLLSRLTNPTVIFIGDIVHRGIKNSEDTYFINGFFRAVSRLTKGRVFSVVGNHELSYRKNNPFWGVSDIQSKYIQAIVPQIYDVIDPLVIVPDDLVIGDMQYSFGHYGRIYGDIYNVAEGVKEVTLLSHNSLLVGEVLKYFNDTGTDLQEQFIKMQDIRDTGSMPRTNLLKYVYVGHLHKAHSVFKVEENINGIDYSFSLRYLASLGRTNHSEYTDDILRQLPIHKIRNGIFVGEDLYTITLPTREASVDERVVLENKEGYERQKELRTLKKIEERTMDLIVSVDDYIKEDATLLDWFRRAGSGEFPIDLLTLMEKYN